MSKKTLPCSLDEFRARLDNVRDYSRDDKTKGYILVFPNGRRGRRAFAEMMKRMDDMRQPSLRSNR